MRKRRILVVDDTRALLEELQILLKLEGYDARVASDGFLGLVLAKSFKPHLILCDIMMPGIDGYQFLERLRADSQTSHIPLIFLSALSTQSDFRAGMGLGADDYLTKPFDHEDLLRAIDVRLARHKYALDTANRQVALKLSEVACRQLDRDELAVLLSTLTRPDCSPYVGVLFFDVDRFHRINEVLGWEGGDRVLAKLCERLNAISRPDALVFRLPGARFAQLVPGIADNGELNTEGLRLVRAVSEPLEIDSQQLRLTVSSGGSLWSPSEPRDPSAMSSVQRAETAAIQARNAGRNRFRCSTETAIHRLVDQVRIEQHLANAMNTGELYTLFQPKVSLQTGHIIGVEALCRWRSAVLGQVSPSEFIPVAERAGLIDGLGDIVLGTVCRATRTWLDHGFHIHTALNLSAQQWDDPLLVSRIERQLVASGCPPSAIVIEITESSAISRPNEAAVRLEGLRDLGVAISIDDFGTGFSNLTLLRQLPLDELKIDRTFVVGLPDDAALPQLVLQLGETLGLRVVAEGIETREGLTWMREANCHVAQGFYLARPMDAAQILKLLSARQPLFDPDTHEAVLSGGLL